jgi:DNA transformation protein
MGELSKLPNIAAKLEAQLVNVGVTTEDELRQVGSREAWLRILARDPSACIMRLSSLEGAIQGIRWHDLDDDTKISLKEFYSEHKGKKMREAAGEIQRRKPTADISHQAFASL